ncbi:hypothetical protein Dfri01_58990 [Dyadobacter frigoris]|nr:hypothetical protein Dfri01_58990 [Dyadobacter frigoris]
MADGVHMEKDGKVLIQSFESDSLTFINYQNVSRLTKNIFIVSGVKSTWRPGKDNWEHDYSNIAIINSDNTIDWYPDGESIKIDLKDFNSLINKISILNSLYQTIPKPYNFDQLSKFDFNNSKLAFEKFKTSQIDCDFDADKIISISKYAMLFLLREIIFHKLDLIFTKNERVMRGGSLLQFKYDIKNVSFSGNYIFGGSRIYILSNKERLIIIGPMNEIFNSPFILTLPMDHINLSIVDILDKYENVLKESIIQEEEEKKLAELRRLQKEKEDEENYPW